MTGTPDGRWSQQRWTRIAWGAIALGAVARLVWIMAVHPPYEYVFSDMQGYVERAARLASGQELVRLDAFYPPGTHVLLAVPFHLFGTGETGLRAGALLWWALSSATPVFVWLFARRLLDPAAAALAAVLCAVYPLFIFYAGFFTSETPSLALLMAGLWLALRARQTEHRAAIVAALGAGALGAASIASRPQFVLNLAIGFLPVLWQWRSAWRPAAALAVSAVVVLGGVVALNSAAADRLTGISENGGLIFFQGQCDVHLVSTGSDARGGRVEFGNPVAFELDRGVDRRFPQHPAWEQGFFYSRGLDCVRENGLGHISRLGRNVLDAGAGTTPFPLGAPSEVKPKAERLNQIMALLLPFLCLGTAVALVKRRRRGARLGPEALLLLHFACVLPVVVIFSSEPRYRVLYDVFALMLLAVAVTYVNDRLRALSRGQRSFTGR